MVMRKTSHKVSAEVSNSGLHLSLCSDPILSVFRFDAYGIVGFGRNKKPPPIDSPLRQHRRMGYREV